MSHTKSRLRAHLNIMGFRSTDETRDGGGQVLSEKFRRESGRALQELNISYCETTASLEQISHTVKAIIDPRIDNAVQVAEGKSLPFTMRDFANAVDVTDSRGKVVIRYRIGAVGNDYDA